MIEFKSFLAHDLEDYIEFREAAGYRYKNPRWFLSTIDRHVVKNGSTLPDLTPAWFLDFRQDIDAEPGTINKIFIWLRGFFDYMVRMEKISENPVADIPALSENNYIPFVFSPEQTDALLSAVESQIRKNRECFFVRDLAVCTALCLMARCGLRISEPFRLRDRHWRRDEMTIYIEKTKFNKDRLIPVPKIVIPVLDNFLAVRNAFVGRSADDIPLLTVRPGVVASKHVARKYFHRAVERIGIRHPKTTIGNMTFGHPRPHSLRHSFAVNTMRDVRQRGRSAQNALPILAAYLGHTDWRYTMKYLKVTDAEHGKALVDFCVKHKRGDLQ
ncbi:MAG: tyrosine-type recombinase/integrase [Chloroflexi bacterium]|nr:tyrosine-type recombinase/integrase [Chloroflexota bacterium]